MTVVSTSRAISRRAFLRYAGAAGGAVALAGTRPFADRAAASLCTSTVPDAQIGIQLFTCTGPSIANRDAVLEQIAGLGYQLVEHAGYGSDAAAFRASLDRFGLRAVSGHTALPRPYDEERWRQIVADALVIGQRYIVWPSSNARTVDDWIDVANIMNSAGRVAREMGMGRHAVGYHNHAVEYQPIAGDVGNRRPIDILMEYCNPRLTHMQMDIGWAWAASDPVAELHRYPGRFRQFHVKDMVGVPYSRRHLTGSGTSTPGSGAPVVPGAGMVDFRAVFTAAKDSRQPIESFLVENDTSIATCLDAAVAGYQMLHGMQYPHACQPRRPNRHPEPEPSETETSA